MPRREQDHERHTRLAFLTSLLGTTTVVGVLGFKVFCNTSWIDALFYSIITLTTVGLQAPPNLTDEGKVFIIVFLVFGIGTVAYALGQLTEQVMVERMLTVLGKRRDRRMDMLQNHWILCGFGRIGRHVAEMLKKDDIPFVIIEQDATACARAREAELLVVQGDAREETILQGSGIARAAGLIVSLDNDANSVYVVLSARAENPKLRIVVRANDSQSVNVLYRSGADKVLNPLLAGASALAKAAVNPAVADFLELINITRQIDLRFDSVRIAGDSAFCGKTLMETPLRAKYNLLVVAVKKPNGAILYNPPGSLVLDEGDELIFLGEREKISDARTEAIGTAAFQHAAQKASDENRRHAPTGAWPH